MEEKKKRREWENLFETYIVVLQFNHQSCRCKEKEVNYPFPMREGV